jgi:predicted Zn finger-like uncharacterized protein
MKFVCDRCQTKYSIADDKVRGKVLKVRCKTCQNVITVREPGARPSVGSLAPVKSPSHPRPSAPIETLGESHEEMSERTQLAAMPAALMADLAQPRRATPPPPPPLGDGVEWFLALDGAQQGPFTQKGLVDKLLHLPKDADVHVWNEDMDGWKPPKDVPPIARDLAAHAKPPAIPVKPPIPRTTPAPPVPPVGAGARRGTLPLTSGVGGPIPGALPGGKLPLPVAAVGAAHAVPTPASHPNIEDAAAALATPPPLAAHAPHHAKGTNGTNGLSAHGAAPRPVPNTDTDALSALNLGPRAAPAVAAKPSSAPRIMDQAAATAWEGQATPGKGRGTKFAVAFLGVIGVIVAVVVMSMTKKSETGATAAPKPAYDTEAMGKLAETLGHEKATAPTTTTPTTTTTTSPTTAPEPTRGGSHGHGKGRTVVSHQTGGGTTATTTTTPTGTTTTTTTTTSTSTSSGFRERSVTAYTPTASRRPPPSQGDISRVINNNKLGIKTCYQRALLRDSNLTHGKIIVGLSVGLSGRVKSVKVDGPTSFRALEPCIKEMVQRWAFPPSDEEYGTEFSYVFQGNE